MMNSSFRAVRWLVKVKGRFFFSQPGLLIATMVACPGSKVKRGGRSTVICFTSCVMYAVRRIFTTSGPALSNASFFGLPFTTLRFSIGPSLRHATLRTML